MKKFFTFVLIVMLVLGMTACDADVAKEIELDYVPPVSGGVLSQTTTITDNDQQWTFVSTYDTGRYDLSRWRVTDNKIVHITAKVKDIPDGTEVLIEHVHADINVKTTKERTNGFLQDSMDDSYHGYSQDGFYISTYPYEEIFAIEGYNEAFISGYTNAYYGSVSERRINESVLISGGAYAQQITVVYDLLVKYPGEDYYHTIAVLDEILIPLNGAE